MERHRQRVQYDVCMLTCAHTKLRCVFALVCNDSLCNASDRDLVVALPNTDHCEAAAVAIQGQWPGVQQLNCWPHVARKARENGVEEQFQALQRCTTFTQFAAIHAVMVAGMTAEGLPLKQVRCVEVTKGVKMPVTDWRVRDYELGLKGTVSPLTSWGELRSKYLNLEKVERRRLPGPGREDYVPDLPSMPPTWQNLGVEVAAPNPSSSSSCPQPSSCDSSALGEAAATPVSASDASLAAAVTTVTTPPTTPTRMSLREGSDRQLLAEELDLNEGDGEDHKQGADEIIAKDPAQSDDDDRSEDERPSALEADASSEGAVGDDVVAAGVRQQHTVAAPNRQMYTNASKYQCTCSGYWRTVMCSHIVLYEALLKERNLAVDLAKLPERKKGRPKAPQGRYGRYPTSQSQGVGAQECASSSTTAAASTGNRGRKRRSKDQAPEATTSAAGRRRGGRGGDEGAGSCDGDRIRAAEAGSTNGLPRPHPIPPVAGATTTVGGTGEALPCDFTNAYAHT
eukprot:GHVU01063959.1.p1 GENE.GHVU01063959.1~~GHVU01063959.1.p1  ORF type:complete len:512 (+),score=58.61 GHVU01063959.1:123-1658(+)